jgi:hypothetical protein
MIFALSRSGATTGHLFGATVSHNRLANSRSLSQNGVERESDGEKIEQDEGASGGDGYEPDFIVRLKGLNGDPPRIVIVETKGYDPLKEIKRQAAERWVAAVNEDGRFGVWRYQLIEKVSDVPAKLAGAVS